MCIGFLTLTGAPSKRIQSSNLNFTTVFYIMLLLLSYSSAGKDMKHNVYT